MRAGQNNLPLVTVTDPEFTLILIPYTTFMIVATTEGRDQTYTSVHSKQTPINWSKGHTEEKVLVNGRYLDCVSYFDEVP